MSFDIKQLIDQHAGENYALYEEHVNPRFAKALRIIGFDRCYEKRAEGAVFVGYMPTENTSTCWPVTALSTSAVTIPSSKRRCTTYMDIKRRQPGPDGSAIAVWSCWLAELKKRAGYQSG